MYVFLPKMCCCFFSRQVVSHGSGLSRQVSLYAHHIKNYLHSLTQHKSMLVLVRTLFLTKKATGYFCQNRYSTKNVSIQTPPSNTQALPSEITCTVNGHMYSENSTPKRKYPTCLSSAVMVMKLRLVIGGSESATCRCRLQYIFGNY